MNINAWITAASLTAGLLASTAPIDARAATSQNISSHGSACRNFNAAQALDIDYLTTGVRNLSADARSVICPITVHPVTGPGQNFYVDGSNANGASTSCTLYAYSFNGTFLSSVSFTRSDATYDHYASLPSVTYWGYTSMLCTLPGNRNGVLFGVIAIDS
jgi:hypothetical protein